MDINLAMDVVVFIITIRWAISDSHKIKDDINLVAFECALVGWTLRGIVENLI